MPMNKVVHAAQRAAFSAAIDVAINAVRGKGTEKLSENACHFPANMRQFIYECYTDYV